MHIGLLWVVLLRAPHAAQMHDYPAQPLAAALEAFARDSGLQLVYRSELTAGLSSKGAAGQRTSEDTLRALLRDTGLGFAFINPQTVTLFSLSARAATPIHPADAVREKSISSQTPTAPHSLMSRLAGLLSGCGATGAAISGCDQNGARISASAGGRAGAAMLEELVITGSRVITQGTDSPTPLTTMSVTDLAQSHPGSVFEGLLALPEFAGSHGATVANPGPAGGSNNNVSALDLRGLTPIRTLVLWDGHRLGPSEQDGWLNVNVIPQLLLQRVDVVTGGASAVYGSDAIGGVVNFVTDTRFTGFRVDARGGMSGQGDDGQYDAGVAAGATVLDGRGHFEVSAETQYQAGILHRLDRSRFAPRWTDQGNGCALGQPCLPYFLVAGATISTVSFGGKITGPSTNPYAGYRFLGDGSLTQFANGSSAGVATSGIQIGGDGAYDTAASLVAREALQQFYGRFDLDLAEHLHYDVMVAATLDHTFNWWTNNRLIGVTMDVQNSFLPLAYQQAMMAGGTTFSFGKLWGLGGGIPPQSTDFRNRNLIVNTELQGSAGSFIWDLGFLRTVAWLDSRANDALDNGRLYAAMDAVRDGSGRSVCRVTLTNPGLYPGCVPIDLFGVGSESQSAIDYVTTVRNFHVGLPMNDVSASVSGTPWRSWAGPISTALSFEWRDLGYRLDSDALPSTIAPLDCTGLLYNCKAGATNQYSVATAYRPSVGMTVSEAAMETRLPLLQKSRYSGPMEINAAYRYAAYRVDGNPVLDASSSTHTFSANTWKVGLDWHLNDVWTLRATRSRDFRAPTLNDLFAPASVITTAGFSDALTGTTPTARLISGGNPTLRPEIAYTGTMGLVFRHDANFNVSLDAYDIQIKNAIVQVSGYNAQIQQACYLSGGSSPYCPLIQRTGGYLDTSASNVVTAWVQENVNAALEKTWGADLELNWSARLLQRPLRVRILAAWQPHVLFHQDSVNALDYAATVSAGNNQAGAQWRATGWVRFTATDRVSIDWMTRWRSNLHLLQDPTLLAQANTSVPAVAFSDLNITYRFNRNAPLQLDCYLNIQNVLNQAAPTTSFAGTAPEPGLFGGYALADDPVGRYYNVGVRVRL